MTNVQIDDERAVDLASLGMSNYAVAKEMGCDEASVRRALNRVGFKRHLIPVDLETRFSFDLDQPLVLKDTDAMVTADWHIPVYDAGYVNEMILTARDEGIRTLIVAGDFFNFDALSAYDPKQSDADLAREYHEGLAVMRTLGESFDDIYYLWGNHDARLHKALGYAMRFRDAMKMVFGALGSDLLKKMQFTNLDHMWVEFEGQKWPWYICHPATYTRNPLTNARKIAAKQNANVICAHSHHAAIGYAEDGEKVVVEAGGFHDKRKTAYLQRSTTYPTWQQGYGWFKSGRFHLTTPEWQNGIGRSA